ncbi:MAG: hypothetical protein AUG44_00375 [Actinobacteria bacterium 13_1_20CM_3_71_11]|nr:MAG: hypothetical protein AUG44_00375 [Actinobacteria bacterium 13_1_20CM_3_71_11]
MSFSVDPAALRTFASTLGSESDASRTAKNYVTQHGRMSWHDQGAWNMLWDAHGDFVTALGQRLQHLCDLLDGGAAELDRAADFYTKTDQSAAARTDATYPPTDRPPVRLRGD